MDLENANNILKSQNARCRIYQKGGKLLLRATLPPRPGTVKKHSHQQWLALGLQANSDGLKLALAKAKLVSAQLDCQEFSWEPYLRETSEPGSGVILTGDLVKNFEQSYFSVRARSPRSDDAVLGGGNESGSTRLIQTRVATTQTLLVPNQATGLAALVYRHPLAPLALGKNGKRPMSNCLGQ